MFSVLLLLLKHFIIGLVLCFNWIGDDLKVFTQSDLSLFNIGNGLSSCQRHRSQRPEVQECFPRHQQSRDHGFWLVWDFWSRSGGEVRKATLKPQAQLKLCLHCSAVAKGAAVIWKTCWGLQWQSCTHLLCLSDSNFYKKWHACKNVLFLLRRENKLRLPHGWICYLAPEIVRKMCPGNNEDRLPFSTAADVYAFG